MNHKAVERRIKRHIIAGDNELFFAVQPGLEDAAEMELKQLGLEAVREREPGSLTAKGKLEDLWRCALLCRSISRLYLRLAAFKADGFKAFKDKAARIPWELYFRENAFYRIKITTNHCRLHVHDKIAKSLNHVLSEHFNALDSLPPQPVTEESKENPEESMVQTLIIRGKDDRFTISLDAGGGALYERGYRKNINEAPLRENIAAALLILAKLPENTLLLDSMCGSGTFGLEALSLSAGLPLSPGKERPFEHWPSFRPGRYDWTVSDILSKKTAPWMIYSSDRDPASLNAARGNASYFQESVKSFFPEGKIQHREQDFFKETIDELRSDHPERQPFLILNPPYGRRLDLENQTAFFRRIGKTIRENYKGVPWGIIVPGLECEKALGLRWEKKYLFKNGGFPVCFLLGKTS